MGPGVPGRVPGRRDDTGYVITLTASPSAFEEHLRSRLIVEESFRIA